jgi:hypothetical protein
MSDGLLIDLAAIEQSDHMTSPHADKYDFDGWYRTTITGLIKVIREQHAGLHEVTTSPCDRHDKHWTWRCTCGATSKGDCWMSPNISETHAWRWHEVHLGYVPEVREQ